MIDGITHLELGGGTLTNPGWASLDPVHPTEPQLRRLAQDVPWPIKDDTVAHIRASHVLEHVPSGQPRIDVFNEAWRVLQPGAIFEIILPLVGYTDRTTGLPMSNQIGWQPWADPTHVSFFWFPESLLYFCEGPFKPNADYGIREWQLESWDVRDGWEGYAVLRKPPC